MNEWMNKIFIFYLCSAFAQNEFIFHYALALYEIVQCTHTKYSIASQSYFIVILPVSFFILIFPISFL